MNISVVKLGRRFSQALAPTKVSAVIFNFFEVSQGLVLCSEYRSTERMLIGCTCHFFIEQPHMIQKQFAKTIAVQKLHKL